MEEELILAVSSFPELYDPTVLTYRDSKKKYNAWNEVAEIVGISADGCRKRWKNLRDTHRREIKKEKERLKDPGDEQEATEDIPSTSRERCRGPKRPDDGPPSPLDAVRRAVTAAAPPDPDRQFFEGLLPDLKGFSHQRICKEEEEEDPTDQQVCCHERNSRLNHEDLEPPQIKEEQEELCIKHEEILLNQEGEQPAPKQEADAAVLNSFCDDNGRSEDIIRCTVGSVVSEPNNELHLLHHHVADTQVSESAHVHGSTDLKISCDPFPDTDILKCNTCGKDFNYLSKLQRHLSVHVGKRYVCTTCGKTFKKSCGLSQHLRIHTGEKPYVCTACGKAFIQKGTLSCHMRVHTGEKPYVCATCGVAFKISIDLTRHTRVHTGEKPHVCATCGKGFRLKGTLSSHMRTHTGEKPYVCKKCGKAFSKRSNLSVHVRVHTGKKTYICQTCCKAFSSKWNLSHHIKVHTEARP